MPCIEKIYSVSVLVGSNDCNGNCKFCAAKDLRSQAQKNGDVPPKKLRVLNYIGP